MQTELYCDKVALIFGKEDDNEPLNHPRARDSTPSPPPMRTLVVTVSRPHRHTMAPCCLVPHPLAPALGPCP